MLNTTHFTRLAGNPRRFDDEINQLARTPKGMIPSEPLCRLQERQSDEGYVPYELVKTVYGWSIRYGSGLQGFDVVVRGRGLTMLEVLRQGVDIVNERPDRRELYVRNSSIDDELRGWIENNVVKSA